MAAPLTSLVAWLASDDLLTRLLGTNCFLTAACCLPAPSPPPHPHLRIMPTPPPFAIGRLVESAWRVTPQARVCITTPTPLRSTHPLHDAGWWRPPDG